MILNADHNAIIPSITEADRYTSTTASLEGIIMLIVMLAYFSVLDSLLVVV